eukprot:gene11523-13446_t
MVFEGIVSDVLSRVLGEYVKNLNKDQLKIGVLGGNVVLTNLELKEDALANLPINLPITVKKGFLGRLELRVPWKDLKSKPVIVNIDNVYALAVPQTQNYKYDEEAEIKKEKESKKKRIENYEWLKSIKEAETDNIKQNGDDSFTGRLVTKIIDNLQIVINKIHIRFENRNEIGKLYAVGLTLDKLSAQSTDEKWIASFIDSSKTNLIRKLAEMHSLGVYIDDSATSLQNLSTQEFSEAFINLIPNMRSPDSMTKKFIIKPISSQLKVSINKSDLIEKGVPKIMAECIFSEIACALSSPQLRTVFNILHFTNEFLRDIKFLKYRPNVRVAENPKAWWRYVGQVILEQVKQRRYTHSWAYILQRKKDRMGYVGLFKRSLPNVKWLTPLNKGEQATLADYEGKLSFEDIVFYRSLAYAEIKKEAENYKVRKEFLDSKKSERGFFQNLFNKKKEEDEKEAPIVQLSTNERDELYKTIEYDEVIGSVEEPPEWVKVVANLVIKSVSLQLVDNDQTFIDAVYSSLSVKLEQRKDGVKVIAGIKQFEVYDHFSKNTQYKKIVSSTSLASGTFCSAIVDTAPLDKHADLFVELNMDPLQVIAPKPLILKIVDFFSSDEQIDLTNITNKAGDYIDNLTEKTKMQLQEALDTHKTMSVSVNIHAPVFMIPENVALKNCNALVLDLGNFKIRSDNTGGFKGKMAASSSEDDFYDKFNLSLESVQLVLTNDMQNWNDKRTQAEQKTHIINQFDVHLRLLSCIQQDSLTLTKIKVSGELPMLNIHLSDRKAKQLLQLINSLTHDINRTSTITDPEHQIAPESNVPKPLLDLFHNTQSGDNKAQDGKSLDLVMNHKKLSIKFAIKSIGVTISREQTEVVRIVVDGLSIAFAQRTFDMIGTIELNSLEIDDLLTHSTLKKLATSNPSKDLQSVAEQSSLVLIKFKQFQPNSPEFNKVDMTLDINFHSFYLVCNPPTIHQLLMIVQTLSDQPAIAIKPTTIRVIERRKRVVRTLRAGAQSPASPSPDDSSSPATSTPTTTTPSTKSPRIKAVTKKAPTENISIKVSANITSLGVVLNQENNKKLGIFSINNIKTSTTMYKDTRMSVTGLLGSIVLEDLADCPTSLYKKVITPAEIDKDMLTFGFNTHPKTLSNYQGYDSSVTANIKSIVVNAQIGFLLRVQNYFLGGMLDPILNRPIAVPAPAVDSPPGTVPASIVPISRTKLDVVMETPIFKVPQAIDSTNLLQLELGKIVLSNTFADHSVTKEPIDVMKISIEKTNITIHNKQEVSHFLQRVDIVVGMTRFLSPNHNIDIEDMVIDIDISHISFLLNPVQYRFFLDMADTMTRELASIALASGQNSSAPPPSPEIPYFAEQEVIQAMGKTVLALRVKLPLISFHISNKDTDIAAFEMKQLYVDMRTTERNKLKLQLTMESIVLTDARKNSKNIFINLLENDANKKGKIQPFIQFGYIRDNTLGDQYINIEVNNPALFLSPSPLLLISDFFLLPLQEQARDIAERDALPKQVSEEKDQRFLAQTRKINPVMVRIPSITLTTSINAEVTLVENETQPNTRCIMAKARLHVHFKRDPRGMENAIVSVRRAKINVYRPVRQVELAHSSSQSSRPVQILKPIEHIKITYIKENETSDYWKQSINVNSTIIKLFFSYDDLSTVLKIVQNLNFQKQEALSSKSSQDVSLEKLALPAPSEAANPEEPAEEKIYLLKEKLVFDCPSMSVLLINESMDLYLPIAELYVADIRASVINWTSDLELKTSMMFKSDYFNEGLMKFEPFIEDWTFNFDVKQNGGKMRATFMATKEILNINVSHALIQTLNSTLMLIKQKDLESSSPLTQWTTNSILSKYVKKEETDTLSTSLSKKQPTKFHSHWISNHSGIPFEYSVPHEGEQIQEEQIEQRELQTADNLTPIQHRRTQRIHVGVHDTVPVQIKSSKNRDAAIGLKTNIDLFIDGGEIISVSLDAIGCRIYTIGGGSNNLASSTSSISSTSSNSGETDVMVEVKLQGDGSKMVYIRSMVQFINHSTRPVEIKLTDNDVDGKPIVLGHESKYSLPLDTSASFKRFWFRLEGSPHWSDTIVPADLAIAFDKEREKDKDKEKAGTPSLAQKRSLSKIFKVVDPNKRPSFFAIAIDNSEHRLGSHQTVQMARRRQLQISFNAPIQVENLLPMAFDIAIKGEESIPKVRIECGKKLDIFSYAPGSTLAAIISGIEQYPESVHNLIQGDATSPSISKSFKLGGSGNSREMTLQIERSEKVKGVRVLSFYCQYWLVNNSLLPLVIRNSDNDEFVLPINDSTTNHPPVLYSSNNIKLRINDAKDNKSSQQSPISTVGNTTTLTLQGATRSHDVSYVVDFCQNTKFGISKVVTFTPRYVIQNKLPFAITVGQAIPTKKSDSPSSSKSPHESNEPIRELFSIQPNEYVPLHWIANTDLKAICIKGTGQHWSGAFEIDNVCDMVVRIKDLEPARPSTLCHVNIKEENGTLYVMIPQISKENPPYIVENDTQFDISYHQKIDGKATPSYDHLAPHQSEPLGWDEPMAEHRIVVYIDGKQVKKNLNLKKITSYKIKTDQNIVIFATITIEKSSRLVQFSTSNTKHKAINHWKKNKNISIYQTSSEMQFYVRMSGIGLSIIDQTPSELAYVMVKDFYLQMQSSTYENSLELKIGDLQVDNQVVKTEFPVLLHSSMKADNKKDFLHISLIKSSFNSIDHFRYFSTLIQEMTIEIEDHWLQLVLNFVNSLPDFNSTLNNSSALLGSSTSSTSSMNESLTLFPAYNLVPPTMDSSSLKMVYFALLVLNPIRVNITLSLQQDGLFKTNHKVLSSIEGLGFTLTKLDRAPITLQGLIMEHPFFSWNTMADTMKKTYLTQVLRQFYNILGSIDVIGNPVGLFRNFGTGVSDFFIEPAQGLVKSPADFGKGLAKGTSSLVKNSVYGTFNTISKITGTIGSGLATLSFDDQYQHDRKIHQARKPKHIGEGLAMGGIGLGRGILQGITGIVTKPVEGAKKGGFGGFAKGLVQGVVGVAIKPTAAVIDMTTKATEGIKNTTNLQDDKERVRPPRCFGNDNVLRPFDPSESEGWFLLKTAHKGKHAHELYIWHYPVNNESTVIITNQSLIYVKSKKNFLQSSFIWRIPFNVVKSVVMVPNNGLALKLDPPQDLGLLDRSVKTLTVPVSDDNINMIFNMKIDHALRIFNEKQGHHYNKI